MIPRQEQFLDVEPVTGTIDEILNLNTAVDIDSEEHCHLEIMHEFNVTKEEAVIMYKIAKLNLVQIQLEEMEKEGKLYKCGINEKGEPLYKLTKKKKTKNTKKKK